MMIVRGSIDYDAAILGGKEEEGIKDEWLIDWLMNGLTTSYRKI